MPHFSEGSATNFQQSYWQATAQSPDFPTLEGDRETQAVIIGAGMAGLMTAYFLRQAGMEVTVLEADTVGDCVTCRSTGKVTSSHGLIYRKLMSGWGKDRAVLYGKAQQTAIDVLEKVAADEELDVGFERVPNIIYTCDPDRIGDIEKEVEAATACGLPAAYMDDVALPIRIQAAVSFSNQAQVHPGKVVSALAACLQEKGVRILQHSRALEVTDGDPVTVRTEKGSVQAEHCIVATHFPIYDPAAYFSRVKQMRSYLCAGKYSGEVPGMFIQAEESEMTCRACNDGENQWLILGSGSHQTGHEKSTEAFYVQIKEQALSIFDMRELTHCWSTQDVFTLDGVPYVGRPLPITKNVYSITGFGGWGLSNSVAAAILIADQILHRHNDWERVFSPTRLAAPVTTAAEFVKRNTENVVDFAAGLVPRNAGRTETDLAPGEAAILNTDDGRRGVYRDEEGNIHRVNCNCSHLGCTVRWNSAERSWDCPCHGSRFDVDGKVLNSPAVIDITAD